jgi:hypothetical protein
VIIAIVAAISFVLGALVGAGAFGLLIVALQADRELLS